MSRKRLNQNGDTIVEVLICVAILGFVVAAAYSLATRNQIATQKAQERARATALVETQIESLRSYIEAKKDVSAISSDNFCFVEDSADTLGYKPVALSAANTPNPDSTADQVVSYGSQCTVDGLYKISLWKPAAAKHASIGATRIVTNETYAATVRWETAGGGSYDEVKTFYTIFPRISP